jgi:hypothetical protein
MNESASDPSAKVAWHVNLITSLCSKTSALMRARMYRIELSPGEETVFRSIEELAVAIKRGVVTPRARIYHNASSKWLPIQFHPHYKVAVSMPLTNAALVAGPPVKPLSSLTLAEPQDPEPPVRMAPPAPRMQSPPPPPPSAQPAQRKRPRAEQPAAEKPRRRRTKSRRQLRIALVGALLIGGAQWVLSAPLFSRSDVPVIARTQLRLIAAQTEAMKRVSSANTAAMIPVLPTPAATAAPSFGGMGGTERAAPGAQLQMTPVETATTPDIEPAPSAIDVSAPAAAVPDSLTSKSTDSTNKKTIKRILRQVSGTAIKEKSSTKR